MSGKQNRPEFFVPNINDPADGPERVVHGPSGTIALSLRGKVYGFVTIGQGDLNSPARSHWCFAVLGQACKRLLRKSDSWRQRSASTSFGASCFP